MVVAAAVERLALAVQAIDQGARPDARSVRDADSLPTLDDVPYPTAPGAQALLDPAAEQHGVPVHVLTTGREQRHNGRVMDNCTLSDSYVRACQEGTTIVAAFEHAGQPYNIAWRYTSGTWQRRDLSGKGNSHAPEAVAALADQLTGLLAGLEPGRPIAITTADTRAALVIEPTADLARTEPSQFAIA